MAYTFHDLNHMTVAQMREVAKSIENEHPDVKGYTQLNKEHLLQTLCKALKIDMFEHHHAEVENKTSIKSKIRELKQKRNEAIAAKNPHDLHAVRMEIKKLKNKLRSAMV